MQKRTIEWHNGIVTTIDQTRLPNEAVMLELHSPEEVAEAIRTLRIRGAPLLGASAAFALALAVFHSEAKDKTQLLDSLEQAAQTIRCTRPTAVNLSWL